MKPCNSETNQPIKDKCMYVTNMTCNIVTHVHKSGIRSFSHLTLLAINSSYAHCLKKLFEAYALNPTSCEAFIEHLNVIFEACASIYRSLQLKAMPQID